jgi:hypothetical protein
MGVAVFRKEHFNSPYRLRNYSLNNEENELIFGNAAALK